MQLLNENKLFMSAFNGIYSCIISKIVKKKVIRDAGLHKSYKIEKYNGKKN